MILVAVRDLLFGSKIDSAAKRAGVQIEWAPRGAPLLETVTRQRPSLVVADLNGAGIMNELRTICAEFPSTRVIGFLGHLQAELMEEARSIGVTEVLTRGQLAARLESVLRDNEPQGS